MSTKQAAISLIITAVLAAGAIVFIVGANKAPASPTAMTSQNNVVTTDGKQIIEIDAKGGYSPRNTVAKAGIPTVFKIKTDNTFDCSAALVIPSIGYRKNLPYSGETLIEVPAQKAGSTLRGLCAMGMYSFTVAFN